MSSFPPVLINCSVESLNKAGFRNLREFSQASDTVYIHRNLGKYLGNQELPIHSVWDNPFRHDKT